MYHVNREKKINQCIFLLTKAYFFSNMKLTTYLYRVSYVTRREPSNMVPHDCVKIVCMNNIFA